MSSTTYNPSTFVDAQGTREFHADVGLRDPQLYNTSFTSTQTNNYHLPPFASSHTVSNSASPLNHLSSTPGESISDYSYQTSDFSELEDPFLGVDFDAGVIRTDSLPSNLTNPISYQPPNLNRALPDLPKGPGSRSVAGTYTASTYPLSPVHSSIPNTPSLGQLSNGLRSNNTISQHELNHDLYNHNYQTAEGSVHTGNITNTQLTPDQSGSSHTSAEGLEPSTMVASECSPHVMVSQWGHGRGHNQPRNAVQPDVPFKSAEDFATHFVEQDVLPSSRLPVARADDGSWMSNQRTGQAGLDPESRRDLADELVPTLDEAEERRRILSKNIEVNEWRSRAGASSEAEDERSAQSYFPPNNPTWYQESGARRHRDPAEGQTHDYINAVDDAASIRENKLVDGQVYFHPKNGATVNEHDQYLMSQPRHWNDAPTVPTILTTVFQPQTSNAAMEKFRQHADTISIASRAATWGTRRRSEPSLADLEAVGDGSFLRKLTITKAPETGRLRGQGFLANLVRKHSDSKLKRSHSSQNITEDGTIKPASRQNSAGTLAPPPRTSSFGKRQTPSINTALAAMAGPLAAIGTTHARNGSVSAKEASPRSPIHLGWPERVITRVRSRSDITSTQTNSGIAGLWRVNGGPPVPTLASPPIDTEARQADVQDQDDEDDDDDDQVDEGDLKAEGEQADPIIANYYGFKAHVRRLNPEMEPRYNWLVSRIAHQQEIRYKSLLELRVKHSQAISNRSCSAGTHCVSMGGSATLLDIKGNPEPPDQPGPILQLVTDFSDDDSNHGERALTEETFPPGVPMPPTRNLPAEFECQLCFKSKKFQKPSDWTKHVHEDVQPFTCTYDKCKEPKSFKRKADWVRHENERHRHLEWWICQVDDCRHPCYRKDNFLQHLVREHKLPEPKQKTKAAIKKARLTEPAWRMLEQCHHETKNRPQDEPCKFCGRTFTTWKKLTVHLAKHMELISLPTLKLVELRSVDANTIISPVEQNHTPVTPIGRTKMESASPFKMGSVSPHMALDHQQFPASGYDHSVQFPTAGSTNDFVLQTSMGLGMYNENNMYSNPNNFEVQQMQQQPRGFGSFDSGGLNLINQARFTAGHTGYQHQRTPSRPYGSLDNNYSHQLPSHNFDHTPNSVFSMPQEFTSAPALESQYPTANMLGISNTGFGYDPMTVSTSQSYQQQSPMARSPANNNAYSHPAQNLPYYGPQ
ncbi:hypothetical protein HYALB_00008113 [Hymenoscyphus albidus]|uniref:C2H2-type domain-containing protein n=1 Tax=Hymenoscyphus albidus TaxID=595503 RepID=A0A9N9QCP4_9HELO|nr:hypothetical protein HYALB_00008113 [Hymenoscyphus albidus]